MATSSLVSLDRYACPAEHRLTETVAACVSHDNRAALPALLGDRRNSRLGTQRGVISFGDRLSSLAEHRGCNRLPDTWQGEEDGGITMLIFSRRTGARRLRQLIEQRLDSALAIALLLVR